MIWSKESKVYRLSNVNLISVKWKAFVSYFLISFVQITKCRYLKQHVFYCHNCQTVRFCVGKSYFAIKCNECTLHNAKAYFAFCVNNSFHTCVNTLWKTAVQTCQQLDNIAREVRKTKDPGWPSAFTNKLFMYTCFVDHRS